jgi:hypothetical protein
MVEETQKMKTRIDHLILDLAVYVAGAVAMARILYDAHAASRILPDARAATFLTWEFIGFCLFGVLVALARARTRRSAVPPPITCTVPIRETRAEKTLRELRDEVERHIR